MKREDLYALRGRTAPRIRTKPNSSKRQSLYPFCHLLQLVASIICLLIVGLSSSIFSDTGAEELHLQLKLGLTATIQMPADNWDGSLAALFVLPE